MAETEYLLYHYPLCPFSRKVRVCLWEKGISYDMVLEDFWKKRFEFIKMNPAGDLPVLVERKNGQEHVFSNHTAICEYLNETVAGLDLFGADVFFRAEVRRICGWFDILFYKEVTLPLTEELVFKRLAPEKEPDSVRIRSARHNLNRHMKYIEWLSERRNYLAGRNLSLADFDVASHVSVLDYLGEIDWDKYPEAKQWYWKLKSRQSVQSLLKDRITGIIPPDSYLNLDF